MLEGMIVTRRFREKQKSTVLVLIFLCSLEGEESSPFFQQTSPRTNGPA